MVPDDKQGESFARLAAGQPQPDWRTATNYRDWMHRTDHEVPAHFGIRTERYQLIFYYGVHYEAPDPEQNTPRIFPGETAPRWAVAMPRGWEFYDLGHDPEEADNRYADPAYRDVIDGLKRKLARQRETLGDTDEAYPHIARIVRLHWDDSRPERAGQERAPGRNFRLHSDKIEFLADPSMNIKINRFNWLFDVIAKTPQ